MPPRVFLPLAFASFVALGASAALAAPPVSPPPAPPATTNVAPLPSPPPAPPAAAPAAAPEAAPEAAPAPAPAPAPLVAPPVPPGAQRPPPWAWRAPPPAYGPYPGWRLEEEAPKSSETNERTWYGWQSLLGIIPSHGLAVVGVLDHDLYGLIVVGALGHCFTSPIVHWVHGNTGRGFISLGMNAGLPILSSALINVASSADMFFGVALLAVVGWPIVDVAVLSYEDPPSKSKEKTAGFIDSFGVVPMIDREKKGLSLVGRF
ncbi:hypothetical protein [Polyangium sp. 6x1]|uniref:hypothetical protein n=1 Tax=Polyangium sp. 6x1 TaxID=3042689 RepID=UPI00248233CE|nr:hypothetical protein [Polyangium sp. 6x1]MDI1448588.1 hypothetical protein [Polyangium sp. 6x1]